MMITANNYHQDLSLLTNSEEKPMKHYILKLFWDSNLITKQFIVENNQFRNVKQQSQTRIIICN